MDHAQMFDEALKKMINNYLEGGNATIKELAEAIGICATTFSRKLNGISRWHQPESIKLLAIIRPEVLDDFVSSLQKHQ